MSDIVGPVRREHSSAFPVLEGRGGRSVFSKLEARLRDVSNHQDELSETRQQVLIDRQRVASSARQIQNRRHDTAGKEARLMDILRKYFTELGKNTPEDLVSAYSEVEESRNELVAAEDIHNDKEQQLELSEVALTDQEADLYQLKLPQLLQSEASNTLKDPAEPTGLPLSYSSSEATQRTVTQDREISVHGRSDATKCVPGPFGDNDPLERVAYPERKYLPSCVQSYDQVNDSLIHRELETQNAQVEFNLLHNCTLINDQITRGALHESNSVLDSADATQYHPQSSLVKNPLPTKGDEILKPSINNWILTNLGMNATERLLQVAIICSAIGEPCSADLDFAYWNEHAIFADDQSDNDHSQLSILQDWYCQPSQSPTSYDTQDPGVDILIPRVQSDSLLIESYGAFDLDEENKFEQQSAQINDYQPEESFPLLQVTATPDELFSAIGNTDPVGGLTPGPRFCSRNDNAHTSEVGTEVPSTKYLEDTMHGCTQSEEDHSIPDESLAPDTNSHDFTMAPYDSLYSPSSNSSRRNSDSGNDYVSDTMSRACDSGKHTRVRSWQSSPSANYLESVLYKSGLHNTHYNRVQPAQYNSFFTSGRLMHIFEVRLRETRRKSVDETSQSSRDSSPRRQPSHPWSESGQFVVILNKGHTSLCA
ncbi:hypothetical protein DE146DRAFT_628388 [Phaeosphaeria sp. MPI-PUGE-AT-0046c]|nr:hypothetical protein DE146DRAFT_628388 [Phaeosphaeria sp. MPI-PUGE-AT-0046c]